MFRRNVETYMAAADLSVVVEVSAIIVSHLGTHDELGRGYFEWFLKEYWHDRRVVSRMNDHLLFNDRYKFDKVRHIAHHHPSKEVLPILSKYIFLVRPAEGIFVHETVDWLVLWFFAAVTTFAS